METIVVSGGTDGIGKGIALHYVGQGSAVIILGRSAEKGYRFVDETQKIGAGGRAYFIHADLRLVSENKRAIEEVGSKFSKLDALVLCAQHYHAKRLETKEGFESTFALYYLSRFVLSYGLADLLEKSENPVIVNVCGPGIEMGEIRWNDLGRQKEYHGLAAIMQGSRLNDLLGVAFAINRARGKIKYVLFNPGGVATSFSGEYDEEVAVQIENMKRLARPVREGIIPIIATLDKPPTEALSASMMGEPISLNHRAFDRDAAVRLYAETKKRLRAGHQGSS